MDRAISLDDSDELLNVVATHREPGHPVDIDRFTVSVHRLPAVIQLVLYD